MITATFAPVPSAVPSLENIAMMMKTMMQRPSISKPTWVIQLNREGARVATERSPADHERCSARLRSGEARDPEKRVEDVAYEYRPHGLPEREPERDDEGSVDQELDVPHRAGPHPEETRRAHPPVRFRDQLDATLLQLARLVVLGARTGIED